MPLLPELVSKKYREGLFDVLISRAWIVGGLRVVDEVVKPSPFFWTEVKHRRVISFEMLGLQIDIICVGKIVREC
jgi:hypothetical protein